VHLLCDALPRARGRSRLIVIGLGNAFRGDDAAGVALARALGEDPRVIVHEGEPIDLLDRWEGASDVIVVDAVNSGAPPGTIHRLDPLAEPIPTALSRGSTHALGLAEAIELARALDRLPHRLVVYGIEGERFTAGEALSPAVARAVERLRSELRERLGKCTAGGRQAPDGGAPAQP
jgi:hydrogenase maturation protease